MKPDLSLICTLQKCSAMFQARRRYPVSVLSYTNGEALTKDVGPKASVKALGVNNTQNGGLLHTFDTIDTVGGGFGGKAPSSGLDRGNFRRLIDLQKLEVGILVYFVLARASLL